MAYSLISTAVDKLNTILQDEIALLVGVTDDIKKLSRTFTLIQAVLKDAETRRVRDEAVKIWLENVKDLAYDVDDILDEWMTDVHRSQAPDGSDGSCFSKKKVISLLSPVSCFNHVTLRHRIGSGIKEVRGRLDDIEKEMNLLRLSGDSGVSETVESEVRRGERETGSLLDQPSVVGREDDKQEVLHLLLRESSGEVNEVPFVISIVGMGGLGKTTLAQLAYNDEEVKRHFEMRMWVCVSEDFNVKQITESIIKSADTEFKCENLNLDRLQLRLRDMLHGKRFLIVLDDIWCEDSEKWEKLKLPFQAGASGSRIVVTTRKEKVASAMGRARIHKLTVLSDDDCWLVFWRRALKHRSAEERSELEAIGKEIVKKCAGLPLAAKTIGSAMCSRRTRREWELVFESDIWNSEDVLQGVLPALLLSYQDLPPALKQCFAYFSIFPKDWNIQTDVTVKLWVAQGFIRSEEIGELYFDDLLRRSLLQDAELDDDRNIRWCKMHDLVHDLAQSVAGSDCLLVDIRKQASLNLSNLRHSLLVFSDEDGDEVASIWPTMYKAKKLRTLLCVSRISKPMVSNNLFDHFRHLRALDLSDTRIQKLPGTVGKLKQLRYLRISGTEIKELPEGVGKLTQLRYLNISGTEIKELPEGVGKLTQLRYLYLSQTEIKELPEGVGKLTQLRYLDISRTKINELPEGVGKLTQLRYLDISRTKIKELPEGVGKSEQLRYLDLSWTKIKKLPEGVGKSEQLRYLDLSDTGIEELPEGVGKSEQLRYLDLSWTKIKKLPEGVGKSEQLRYLNLSDTGIEELPEGVGKSEQLRYLDLSGTEIKELPEEVSNCVNLQTLKLNYCKQLKKLPKGLGKMINLRHLELEGTRQLKYLPQGIGRLSSLRTIEKLIVEGGIEGCKWGEVKQLINRLHLQGRFEIIGLEKVKSRDEAREAELYKQQDIYDLSLEYRGDEALDDDDEVKRMEDVLEILKPHTNLKEFEIRNYKGWKLPKWIEDPVFSNLVQVGLWSCDKCKQLPGLGKLPSLKVLFIDGMEEVRKVGGEFSGDDNNDGSGGGGGVSFPKLEKLFFGNMSDWEEWELRGGDGEVMPSLLELRIHDCKKLKELPSNLPPLLRGLSLSIGNDGLPSGGPLPILPNLIYLDIRGSNELTSFPCGWLPQLKALKNLYITKCSNLRSLPAEELQHLTMLQGLIIWDCPLLKERYGEGGEDRDKIAHIPNITISAFD